MTNSSEITRMLAGLIVNGSRVGMNISDMGAQEDMLVKDTNGKEYLIGFASDGIKIYDPEDEFARGQFSVPTSSIDGYTAETGGSYISNMLKINSFFIGGGAGEQDAPAATHCYVELSNSLRKDLSLNSVMLMYLEAGSSTWKYIKLKGHIPAHGTYLIRGARVGYPSNETVDVDSCDMEWYDDGELISFDSAKGGTFYLCAHDNGTIYSDATGTKVTNPANFPSGKSPFDPSIAAPKGYIDCTGAGPVGSSIYGEAGGIVIGANEKLYKCIVHRMYGEDSCSKVNKAWAKRKTSTFFTYCNMENSDSNDFPYWDQTLKERLAPKASYKNKVFLDDKSALRTDKPNCINQTFGIQGSETTANAKDATRCFTWVSVGCYDEYIEYKKSTDSTWTRLYSIDKKDYNRNDGMHYYGDTNVAYFIDAYTRMKWVSVGRRLNVTHRAIIRNLTAGTYDYRVGRDGYNNYTSDIRQFVVKCNPSKFTFVQTTDQQGYGFFDYGAWKKSAYAIGQFGWDTDYPLDFTINTGDASQNGNRENEWVDYFNGKVAGSLQDIPEMAVIGNNDLGSVYFYTLNDDASTGTSKVNSMTLWCWYTYELDESNPQYFTFKPGTNPDVTFKKENVGYWPISYDEEAGTITYFVPSLYSYNYGGYHFIALNSEFATNSGVYKLYYNDSAIEQAFKGATYYSMYCWLAKDIAKYSSYKKIAYAHEIPFCISPTTSNSDASSKARAADNSGMSKLNHDFSAYMGYAVLPSIYDSYKGYAAAFSGGCCFSELFQLNSIKLCLGGHKHTYCLSYPIIENITYTYTNSSGSSVTTHNRTTALTGTITKRAVQANLPVIDTGTTTYYTRTINSTKSGYDSTTVKKTDWSDLCPVTYCMCQATGYKLASNNDKPGNWTNWLKEYFPYDLANDKVNAGQTWAMCNGLKCDSSSVNMTSYQVVGVTAATAGSSSPKAFNINSQYQVTPVLSTFKGVVGLGSNGGLCQVTVSY